MAALAAILKFRFQTQTFLPIYLKLNSVAGHHLGKVLFKIGATSKNKMAAILKFCNLKVLLLINFKLDKVEGQNPALVFFFYSCLYLFHSFQNCSL